MDSALHCIHNDSDAGTCSGFSPDEERRAKVQVSDPKHVTFTPLFNPLLPEFGPSDTVLERSACVSYF